MHQSLSQLVQQGDIKAIARSISLVENETDEYESLLTSLVPSHAHNIIGITGPPGAGKSTIVDQLIRQFTDNNQSVAVLCVDPSSPFNMGALLGDRIRMHQWYNHPDVFIRSLASRASLGGLHPHIMEIALLLQSAPFDWIIIETVGVGQSEIDIAGLADITSVVLVPESGDEIQAMKSGLMEIADIFIVNKADRPAADLFAKNLRRITETSAAHHHDPIPVIKTVASENKGMDEVYQAMMKMHGNMPQNDRKFFLLTERAYQLIARKRMKDIDKEELYKSIRQQYSDQFNIYRFASSF